MPVSVAVGFHRPKIILFQWNNPSSQENPVFFSLSCFLKGTYQKADPKSSVLRNFASPNFERLSYLLGMGQSSLAVTEFRFQKSQQNFNCLLFWLKLLRTPTVIWMVLSSHTLATIHFLFYMHPICVGSCVSSPLCEVQSTFLVLFSVQKNYSTRYLLYVSKQRPDSEYPI